ncbi:hypothetical protein L1987_03037 [Smallanthus sonchifolius]|uniref:Uncharacterized protein n=1 Tax=Smallanthus sonchifolius TaxID=185202 RepID=A0ACB9K9M8_9ASTR|nr:hypothetical protein L1987_03037 [Smallanthus sonchifolius]
MGGGVTIITVVIAVVLAMSGSNASRARPSVGQCHKEEQLAVTACSSLFRGERPSGECCHRVRVTHAECVCPDVTPAVVAMIGDINRAIRLIESCGRKVPHHFKCGSVTTP